MGIHLSGLAGNRCLTASESATPGLAQYLARCQGQDESNLGVFCLCVEPGGDGSVKHPPDPQGEALGSAPGGFNGDQTTPPPNPAQPSLGLIQFLLNLLLPTTTTTTTTTTPPAETATKCGGLFGGGLIC